MATKKKASTTSKPKTSARKPTKKQVTAASRVKLKSTEAKSNKANGRKTIPKTTNRSKASLAEKRIQLKKGITPVGDIHLIHPAHVVRDSQKLSYKAKKGKDADKKRLVAITAVDPKKKITIAKIYSSSSTKHRVPLSTTKTKKRSWIDKEELKKSESTGKDFEVGKAPLNRRKIGRVTAGDLERHSNAKTQKRGTNKVKATR